jgi:protein MpaA
MRANSPVREDGMSAAAALSVSTPPPPRAFMPSSRARRLEPHVKIRELLLPLFNMVSESVCLRADSLGPWRSEGELFVLPRFVFQRTATKKSRIKLGIFAGIHGDEPAGVQGLIEFVRALHAEPPAGRDYQLWLYPLCNPTGYVDGTRHSRSGKDLNREFWQGSPEPEVRYLEEEMRRENFDGLISLHTDDTTDGVYGFVGGATLTEHLLKPALAAAERALPTNAASEIDGFHAVNGIIHSRYDGILCAPAGQRPAPFEIILETPQHARTSAQKSAFLLALRAILTEYRRVISFASDI